ncbi:MAG TPA: mechanosensitive ion channel family protein [Candidatus Bilamarchaeaceae archaeon]|nr:mechanosensitive ion channel family protein [Candidatus Bilamarchaeaceae archaeon]
MVFEDIELLSYEFAGNLVKDYLIALLVFLLSFVLLKFFKYTILKKLGKISQKTKTKMDDVLVESINSIGWSFYVVLSLYVSLQFIVVPQIINLVLFYVMTVLFTYYAVKGIQHVIDYGTNTMIEKRMEENKDEDTSMIDLLGKILKIVLWVLAALLILSNLGYDVTPMLAGLGIGGIAIAFALQNVLSDVFASFSIYFDKPFRLGDTILVGKDMGTVKKIGIKSTRITTLEGQEMIISNRELTETRIHNYKKMKKRRVVFNFGVTYETPTKKIEEIPEMVKDIMSKIELAELDRVHFNKFGDSALLFEVVYFVGTNKYNLYMDTQQKINIEIKKVFEKEKIEMAYPTQTLYVNKLK